MKPETMAKVRKNQLRLTQAQLGDIIGYSSRQISKMEQGEADIPLWMPYTLAWLLLHGAANVFDD